MGSNLAAFTAGSRPETMATIKAILNALNMANHGMAN